MFSYKGTWVALTLLSVILSDPTNASLLTGGHGHHGDGGAEGHHHHHEKKPSERDQESEASREARRLASRPFPFRIPRTGFSCKSRAPGYYADVRAQCRVYYMCTERGGRQPFLCPIGTLFNQRTLVCDHQRNVNCSKSPEYYHKNLVVQEGKPRKLKEKAKSNKSIFFFLGKKPMYSIPAFSFHLGRGKKLEKEPRFTNSPSKFRLVEKEPQFIKTHVNGQIHFAPLFKEKNRQDLARVLITTSKPKPVSGGIFKTINRPQHNEVQHQEEFFKLKSQNSPIFRVIPTKKDEKLQLLPAQEAGETLAKFRQDPERPVLELVPPPPVSPFQIVGHVMSSEELSSFPDSPVVNISVTSDAKLGVSSAIPEGRSGDATQRAVDGSRPNLGIPLQLKETSGKDAKTPPLIWVSPASLARSPMVSLRHLHDKNFPVRRTLTMTFPDERKRQRILRFTSDNSL